MTLTLRTPTPQNPAPAGPLDLTPADPPVERSAADSPETGSRLPRHRFTATEDRRIRAAVAAAPPRRLTPTFAALAADLGLTLSQVQYRYHLITHQPAPAPGADHAAPSAGIDPAAADHPSGARPLPAAEELEYAQGADPITGARPPAGVAGGAPPEEGPPPTREPGPGPHPALTPAEGLPVTAQGQLVLAVAGRPVAVLTVEISDLAALLGGGLLRWPL